MERFLSCYRNDLTQREFELAQQCARALRPYDQAGVVQLVLFVQTLASSYTSQDFEDRMRSLRPHLVSHAL